MTKYSKGDYTNCRCNICEIVDEDDEIVCNVVTEDFEKVIGILEENEQLKQQKPFLKIHKDYFIQYGDDNELFNLHKPSDIRSLCYLINRENGYDELECEYNEEGYGND